MEDEKLKKIIREAVVTQFNLFDEPTVTKVRKPRKKMTDKEKADRKAERDLKKKIEADKKFEQEWAKRGVFQGNLFPDEKVEESVQNLIKNIVREEVEKVLAEDSGIHIKPENKGKFTQTKKRTGKSTSELLNSPNKKTRKRANFARMAKRGWKPLKNESLNYTQLKNVLGVEDNDEWNAAAETERKEELEGQVWNAISELAGGNPKEKVFKFEDLVNILKSQFGFRYLGPDEEEESHVFKGKQDKLEIYPNTFYPRQGTLRIYNMHIY